MKTADQWSVWLKGNFPEMSLSERNLIIDYATTMENKNKPAYPDIRKVNNNDGHGVVKEFYPGLTKREVFVIAAMQGLCACNNKGEGEWQEIMDNLADLSVMAADATLKKLES